MNLTDFDALSFDCYGTLIDWEGGLAAVLLPWLRANFTARGIPTATVSLKTVLAPCP